MTTKHTTVIYHTYGDKPCHDGLTAAWVARDHLPENTVFIAAKYGDPAPDVTDMDVYILDFSFPRDVVQRMKEQSNFLKVLDHHKTAQDELVGLHYCEFDMQRSGAMMTWEYFSEGAPPPIVQYVQDRDLWRWKLPHSKEVSAYLSTVPTDFDSWTEAARLMHDDLDAVCLQGAAVRRSINQYVRQARNNAQFVTFEGFRVPIINTTFAHSELVGELAEGSDFAIGWFLNGDGVYEYSLRARKDSIVDVGELARRQTYKGSKGGGHTNAAGFRLGRLLT